MPADCHPQQADHCTRCREPFERTAIRYMVHATVQLYSVGNVGITRGEIVPVCKACTRADERRRLGEERSCIVCGCQMQVLDSKYRSVRTDVLVCSNRCAQRRRRASLYRPRMKTICASCRKSFEPKRDDAKFCSVACKQRAYRRRIAVSAAAAVISGQSG